MAEEYKADGIRQAMDSEYTDRADSARGMSEGLKKDLEPINRDMVAAETKITAIQTTLTTLLPQVATLITSVNALTSALALLKAAVAKAQSAAEKAQATAEKAQATADSKPGGPGATGYTVIVKWTTPSGSGVTGPINTSISSGGKNISKQLTSAQSSSLSGLSSGSVVTFAVDIGPNNTVQWKDPTQDNPNLTGRSNFFKTYTGFTVPATSGIKTIIADIG